MPDHEFGKGGPHNADTPGAWTESALVRSSAQMHDERFRECVAIQAQYLYDTFGKFPATVPSLMILNYLTGAPPGPGLLRPEAAPGLVPRDAQAPHGDLALGGALRPLDRPDAAPGLPDVDDQVLSLFVQADGRNLVQVEPEAVGGRIGR